MKLILLCLCTVLQVIASCEDPQCPGGFPSICKNACGCLNTVGDSQFFNSTSSLFLTRNPGMYVKPNVTWSECQPAPQQCQRGVDTTVTYDILTQRLNPPSQGFKSDITYKCINSTWIVDENPGKLYYFTCKL